MEEDDRNAVVEWRLGPDYVHYRAMKKLMAIVDTKSYDSLEEYSMLTRYFPALKHNFPEFNAITQAYVAAFDDGNEEAATRNVVQDFRKGDAVPSVHLNRHHAVKSMLTTLRKAYAMHERKLIKHSAAKIRPMPIDGDEENSMVTDIDNIDHNFCVESCKAARIRRLKLTFFDKKLSELHAAKVAPCLFMSQTRHQPITTEDDLIRIAKMFCVENERQAYERRSNEQTLYKKRDGLLSYGENWVFLARKSDERMHDITTRVFRGKEELINMADTSLCLKQPEVWMQDVIEPPKRAGTTMNTAQPGTGGQRAKSGRGRISVCLNTIRKMFKKKDQ